MKKDLTTEKIKKIVKNNEIECPNCDSNKASFSKDRIRCDECGYLKEENIEEFIPHFRVLERENQKIINGELQIPLILKKCSDFKINNDFEGKIEVRDCDITITGSINGNTLDLKRESENEREIEPFNSLESRDSNVVIGGSINGKIYSHNSEISIRGDVETIIEAREGSEVKIKGNCQRVRARGGSNIIIDGDVEKDVILDDDSSVTVNGQINGEKKAL